MGCTPPVPIFPFFHLIENQSLAYGLYFCMSITQIKLGYINIIL